jgi:hypothetical protein
MRRRRAFEAFVVLSLLSVLLAVEVIVSITMLINTVLVVCSSVLLVCQCSYRHDCLSVFPAVHGHPPYIPG